jgi:hypothetical protein
LLNPPHKQEQSRLTTTARQAAEALFTRKQEHHASSAQSEVENAVARKPRILAALPPGRPDAASTAENPIQETRRAISKSQIDHVRTWLKYGMTVRQAADACGVPMSELKDALRPVVKGR